MCIEIEQMFGTEVEVLIYHNLCACSLSIV